MIPLIGLMYRSFGRYRKENMDYFAQSEWGSRYRDLKWTKQYLPQLEIVKIPDMMHGELVMMRPEEFARKAMEFLQ